MGKVVGAIGMSLVLASAGAGFTQDLGTVSVLPNADTGELTVTIPEQISGEKVFIRRDGTLVTEATVKSSGPAGTVLTVPVNKVAQVHVGDHVSLSSSAPGQVTSTVVTKTTTEVGAPEPPPAPAPLAGAPGSAAVAVSVPGPAPTPSALGEGQLDKVAATSARQSGVSPIMARPTPRGMGVPLFPAPAQVSTEAGIAAPYGQGLAAAAPVGTPYLRSPAFAGPPIIYMPQTVTRVLLPGATPYPSNIMSPPANYVYSSAPFLRTDIYTSLPYGTFYWPQGYAGTTPVEPQVPAYVTAPASAVFSTEADYSTGRYVPGVANQETLNPITAGINSNLIASTTLSSESGGTAASVSAVPSAEANPALTIVQPGPEAGPSAEAAVPTIAPAPVSPFPVLSDGSAAVSATTTSVATTAAPVPALPSLAITPEPGVPALPSLPSGAAAPTAPGALPALPAGGEAPPSALPSLPGNAAGAPAAAVPTPAAGGALPALPAAPETQVAAAPGLPALPANTPASMLPSLPQASPAAAASEIIVDNKTPGGLTLNPPTAWIDSANTGDSYQGNSVTAKVDPTQPATATFNATIPADGLYEVALWFVGGDQFRSNAVPVTINTATGPQQATIDQTQKGGSWVALGNYQLKAGQNVPVVTLSTEGLGGAGANVSVSVDALRLTPRA